MEIEGDWAEEVQAGTGIEAGRHGTSAANPDNLNHELPQGGPSLQEMLDKYDAKLDDPESYALAELGIAPSWLKHWPPALKNRHIYLYTELMGDREHSPFSTEFKHLLARVSAIAKGHNYLAAVEGFMSHHAATDKQNSLQRIRSCYAAASEQSACHQWFRPAEQSALRLARLSAQTPLITLQQIVQQAIEYYSAKELIQIFTICGLASLVQRFVAIIPAAIESPVVEFLSSNGLDVDTMRLRHPWAISGHGEQTVETSAA